MSHPRFHEFKFDTETLNDGRVRVSSPDLPGFRLVIHPGQDMKKEISDALEIFLPYHDAANERKGDGLSWNALGAENAP